MRKKLIIVGVLSVLLVAAFVLVVPQSPAAANGQPLPPVPSQAILNQVIQQTGGPTFTPLGTPAFIYTRLVQFNGAFNGAENAFDYNLAVNYIALDKALLETVVPLNNSRTAQLVPNFTAPGSGSKPGKVIGVLFQPSRGNRAVQIVVAVFNNWCTSNCTPDKVRFYYNDTQYYENSGVYGEFLDPNGDNVPEAIDAGAVISHKLSCVTVGLDQVCWEPYDHNIVRDEPKPKDEAYDAYTEAKDTYDLSVDFYVDDAVPDLLGPALRNDCAAQLANATSFGNLTQCRPNAVLTASKEQVAGQPIAILVMTRAADLKAYKATGQYHGVLPAGEYLIVDATPYINQPGAVGVLFLVNINNNQHYLIPTTVLQGFGQSSATDERHAGIKDGFASRRSL